MNNRSLGATEFSKSNPIPWRTIDAGLCIEGQCLNRQHFCKAYKQMVIGNFQMGKFLLTSSDIFHCPECRHDVRALKFGLNRCQWRTKKTEKWNVVEDVYQTYNLTHIPVHIEICPLAKEHRTEDCTICLSPMNELNKCSILPCKHIFHMDCIHGWIDADEDASFQCPVCRRPIFE